MLIRKQTTASPAKSPIMTDKSRKKLSSRMESPARARSKASCTASFTVLAARAPVLAARALEVLAPVLAPLQSGRSSVFAWPRSDLRADQGSASGDLSLGGGGSLMGGRRAFL